MSNTVVTFSKSYIIEEESIKKQQQLIKKMFPKKKVSRVEIAESLARSIFDLELDNPVDSLACLTSIDFQIEIEE